MQIFNKQLLTICTSAIIQFASLVKQLREQANGFVSLWSKSASCLELICQCSGGDNTRREDKYLGSIANTDTSPIALPIVSERNKEQK